MASARGWVDPGICAFFCRVRTIFLWFDGFQALVTLNSVPYVVTLAVGLGVIGDFAYGFIGFGAMVGQLASELI